MPVVHLHHIRHKKLCGIHMRKGIDFHDSQQCIGRSIDDLAANSDTSIIDDNRRVSNFGSDTFSYRAERGFIADICFVISDVCDTGGGNCI